MKKYFLCAIFITVFAVGVALAAATAFATTASAAAATVSTGAAAIPATAAEKINARILPTVWFSSLSVNDGDSVKIFAAIQNNAGLNFTGTAVFYVDDIEVATRPFSSVGNVSADSAANSSAGNLTQVSAGWAAVPGDHTVQVKIAAASLSLPSGKTLVSYESDKSSISITRAITAEAVQQAALGAAATLVAKMDGVADALADTIEGFERHGPEGQAANATASVTDGANGIVLGAMTSAHASTTGAGDGTAPAAMDSVFNICLKLVAFLVRNWKWTFSGLVVLFVVYKVNGRRKI